MKEEIILMIGVCFGCFLICVLSGDVNFAVFFGFLCLLWIVFYFYFIRDNGKIK